MLAKVLKALYDKLNGINEDLDFHVNVLTSEKYKEVVANEQRAMKIEYPIIVIYDDGLEVEKQLHTEDDVMVKDFEKDGSIFTETRFPYLPYKLNFKLDVICRKRMQLDSMLLWFAQNIYRGYLDIAYTLNFEDKIYTTSILGGGNPIKQDEGTTSVLYRRIFHISIVALLDNKKKADYIRIKDLTFDKVIDTKGVIYNGNDEIKKHQQPSAGVFAYRGRFPSASLSNETD